MFLSFLACPRVLPTALEKLLFFDVFNEYCVWMGDESVESKDPHQASASQFLFKDDEMTL